MTPKFNMNDKVVNKKIGPVHFGNIIGIVKADIQSCVSDLDFSHLFDYYPNWTSSYLYYLEVEKKANSLLMAIFPEEDLELIV